MCARPKFFLRFETDLNPIPTGLGHVTLIYGLIPPMAGRNRVNCSRPWISEIDCRQKYALRCYLWRWRSGDGRQWQRQQQWQNTKQNIFPPLILRANLSEQVELKHAKQVRRPCKDQLISKCLSCIFNSPKKRTKRNGYTTLVPQVELLSFLFGRIEDTKKTCWN